MQAIYTYPVIGVRCCKTWDIHPVLENVFFVFRYSFCHTSYLHPLPFSATTQVIDNHCRPRGNLTGKLYFVCKRCWTYSRHAAILHEPCWGCAILESTGWEFWTPSRGRSAWWRHPCWMFSLIFFQLDSHWIIQDVMIFQSWPIPHKLCIVNHQGWSSLLHLFKLKRWFFLLECHWILDHFDFNQDWILIEFYCKQSFQGRDATRASHTSRL